jgi:hypothetical protein
MNSLVREALIEGRTTDSDYEKDGYAIKWTFFNDLELIFVVRVIYTFSCNMHNHNPCGVYSITRLHIREFSNSHMPRISSSPSRACS